MNLLKMMNHFLSLQPCNYTLYMAKLNYFLPPCYPLRRYIKGSNKQEKNAFVAFKGQTAKGQKFYKHRARVCCASGEVVHDDNF